LEEASHAHGGRREIGEELLMLMEEEERERGGKIRTKRDGST
jgi:hypothetical protein